MTNSCRTSSNFMMHPPFRVCERGNKHKASHFGGGGSASALTRTGFGAGTAQLRPRQTVRERKTGKTRRVVWSAPLYEQMLQQAGRVWVFESRTDPHKHRTRQAVYKDIKHVAAVFQRSGVVSRSQCIGTHTARKYAAVTAYHKGGLAAAQKMLNHSDPAISLLYALSDKEM